MQETITQLQRHLKAAQSKRPGWAVGLWGEAGIGKTFTVQGLLRESPIASLSLHSTSSFQVIAQALPRPDKLPLWAKHILERLEQNQSVQAQSLLDAVVATLSHLAPFVLHLEDIHETSPERFEWIQKLAGSMSGLRGVGLLVTSRAEPPEPFKAYRREPMDQPQMDRLLEAQANGPLPNDGLDWVFERARGNPLCALEFWRYLRRQSFFWSDGKDWNWKPPPEGYLPVSIEGMALAMFKDLTDSSTALSVLEARSLFATVQPDPELWSRVARVDQETLQEVRQTLIQRGLLASDGFVHPLLREVVLQTIPAPRKQGYARLALEHLEANDPEWAAEFIELAAVEPSKALYLIEQAAQAAAKRGDTPGHAQWLARAVGWSGEDKAQRAMLAAQALQFLNPKQASQMAEIAAAQTPPNPDAVFLLAELQANQGLVLEAEQTLARLPQTEEVKVRWWETSIWVGNYRSLWEEVVQLWDQHQGYQPQAKPRTCRAVGRSLVMLQRLDEAQAIANGLAQLSLSPQDQIGLLNLRNHIQAKRGNKQAALELNQQNLALCRSLGLVSNTITTLLNLATDLDKIGNRAQSQSALEEARTLALQSGNTQSHAVVQMRLAMILMNQGQFEQAETLMLESQDLLQGITNLTWRTENHLKQARLYLTWLPPHGLPLARKHASAALELARQTNDVNFLINALCYLARTEVLLGNAAQALKLAQEALERAQQQQQTRMANAWYAYALALEASEQKAEALGAIQQAIGLESEDIMAQQIGLEADRMNGDLEGARRRYEWFMQQGLAGLAQGVLRYFPGLNAEPQELSTPSKIASSFYLKVLGPVGIEQSGQALVFKAKKRMEVLCYLLEARVAGKSEVELLELMDAFYPEMPETQAKFTIRQLVYLTRTNLGEGSIQSTPNGYALGAMGSDLEDFLKTGDASLWRGTYLQGIGDGWNANLRDGLMLALRSKAEALLSADPVEAARLGEIWLEMEPYDLDALRLTIQALKTQGNTKAAERTYKVGHERLSEVGENLPKGLEEFLGMVAV